MSELDNQYKYTKKFGNVVMYSKDNVFWTSEPEVNTVTNDDCYNCGHSGPNWDWLGNCITCARDIVLGEVNKKVDLNQCMLWGHVKNTDGYGRILYQGKYRPVHRILYEAFYDLEMPDTHVPDHLCEVPACINIDHLEMVTFRENMRRGNRKRRQSHCNKGHLLDSENIKLTRWKGAIRRQCKHCQRVSVLACYYRAKERKLQTKRKALDNE